MVQSFLRAPDRISDRTLVDNLKLEVTKVFSGHEPADYDQIMADLYEIRARLRRNDGKQRYELQGLAEAMAKLDISELSPPKIVEHLSKEYDCHPWHDL